MPSAVARLYRASRLASRYGPGWMACLAIDTWARRSVDQVAAEAVAYAADTHRQVHRARRDMRQLRPWPHARP